MARTINTIYNNLLSIKNQEPELNQLNSGSQTAIYRLIFFVIASGIHVYETLLEEIKDDIIYHKKHTAPHTQRWWQDRFINFFQFNPNSQQETVLKIDENLIPYYEIENDSAKIIDFASAVTTKSPSGIPTLNLKVAKSDSNGLPTPLNPNEADAAQTFVYKLQYAGLNSNLIATRPADQLRLKMSIYFDGTFISSDVKQNINNAIQNYLNNLDFDGVIKLLYLIDAIQSVDGVENIYIEEAKAAPSMSNGNYDLTKEEVFDSLNPQNYTTLAGYAKFDLSNSSIDMIPINA